MEEKRCGFVSDLKNIRVLSTQEKASASNTVVAFADSIKYRIKVAIKVFIDRRDCKECKTCVQCERAKNKECKECKRKKIDLEIDGNQHKYRKEHDTTRDGNLSKIGIYVYRIKWININSKKGKSYIKKEINKFLIFMEKYKIGV